MKRFILAAALATIGAGASAQTNVTSNFNVAVTFAALCNVKTNATNINFGTYTPFTNATITDTSSSVTFRCSQGVAPTAVGFARVSGTAADMTNSVAGTGAATAEGVLSGLRYTLALPSMASALSAGSAGTAASAGANGTGGANSTAKEYVFGITATMPGSQAGATTGDTSQTWQVVLTY